MTTFISVTTCLVILHLLIINVSGYQCTNGDPMTCSLGGKCVNNECQCDPTWKGENCEILDLLPSNQYKAFYRSYEGSWGGSVIYSSNDSLYHMFVSDMSYNCTLNDYSTNSRVIHVKSSAPEGPYTYNNNNITVPIWAHEPTVYYIPNDNIYILYHIGWGNRTGGWVNCSQNYTQSKTITNNLKYDNNTFPNRAITSDLNGKWINYASSHGESEWQCPQAYVYPNGSILYIECRVKCINESMGNICYGISMSERYDKPLQWIASTNVFGEDGYFWRDINGYFHMIYHTIKIGPRLPSHAYSPNGINWYIATTNVSNAAFPFYYTLLNGTRIKVGRRERTQILLDKNGLPSHIFNGIEQGNSHFTFTGVQPINTSYS